MGNFFFRIIRMIFQTLYVRYIFLYSFLYTYLYDAKLLQSYEIFRFENAIGSGSQPWRGYHIIKMLKKYTPKQISEMGSGTSTAVFASYVNRNNRKLITFEQSSKWYKITKDALIKSGLMSNNTVVKLVHSEKSERGSNFIETIDKNSDFIYIDGPVTVKINGQKMPCLDIINFLDSGNFPKTIMIDGRYDTVKAILKHPSSVKYKVLMEHGLAFEQKNLSNFLRFQRHSIFVRKE